MYKAEKPAQMTFEDFNQSCGMKLNVHDEWVVVANSIDWASIEEKYMAFFPSKRGRPAVNARMALGALVIQHKAKLSDRNLVKEVARNPYYQYFIGLGGYQTKCPFGHGVLPELRKRFGMDFINEVNEIVVRNARPTPEHADDKDGKPSANGNLGTMILDATCSPSNMPEATGVNETTDAGTSFLRALIPTNGIAYITGQPAAPQLTAQIKGLPEWLETSWSGTLTTERSERGTLDNRTLAGDTLNGSGIYDITDALDGEIVGGRCVLNFSVRGASAQYPFSIRGKNPLDATARAYIAANVDAEFQPYAWMIAKHESKSGNRVYNQFNPSGNKIELPNFAAPSGWGIAQIDKGVNGDTTAEVYNWHVNVASMNATLIDKRRRYIEIIGLYRAAYQNDPSTYWFEPDNVTTNVNGTIISARQWAIMTLYNGSGGTHPLPFAGHPREKTPIHFDPATTNWILYTNQNNYVPVVFGDANATEVE